MDESLKQRPESVYGESKLISEKIFSWAKEIHNIDYVFHVISTLWGNRYLWKAHNPETHLIPLILQVAQVNVIN